MKQLTTPKGTRVNVNGGHMPSPQIKKNIDRQWHEKPEKRKLMLLNQQSLSFFSEKVFFALLRGLSKEANPYGIAITGFGVGPEIKSE